MIILVFKQWNLHLENTFLVSYNLSWPKIRPKLPNTSLFGKSRLVCGIVRDCRVVIAFSYVILSAPLLTWCAYEWLSSPLQLLCWCSLSCVMTSWLCAGERPSHQYVKRALSGQETRILHACHITCTGSFRFAPPRVPRIYDNTT